MIEEQEQDQPEEQPLTDQELIDNLTRQGYSVEMFNPEGEEFFHRYVVYKDLPPLGKRIVIIDAQGNVVGGEK